MARDNEKSSTDNSSRKSRGDRPRKSDSTAQPSEIHAESFERERERSVGPRKDKNPFDVPLDPNGAPYVFDVPYKHKHPKSPRRAPPPTRVSTSASVATASSKSSRKSKFSLTSRPKANSSSKAPALPPPLPPPLPETFPIQAQIHPATSQSSLDLADEPPQVQPCEPWLADYRNKRDQGQVQQFQRSEGTYPSDDDYRWTKEKAKKHRRGQKGRQKTGAEDSDPDGEAKGKEMIQEAPKPSRTERATLENRSAKLKQMSDEYKAREKKKRYDAQAKKNAGEWERYNASQKALREEEAAKAAKPAWKKMFGGK